MLSETHRPKTFDDMLGQSAVVRVLKWHLDRPADTGKAILLTGPSDSGKTSLAIAAGRYCRVAEHDIRKVESTECDVATLRALSDQVHLVGFGEHGRRLYVLDEAHTISGRAADRLLSLLQSLPPHVLIIATTTETD